MARERDATRGQLLVIWGSVGVALVMAIVVAAFW